MIYINNKKKIEKIEFNKNNFYVVADFDQTMTEGDSNSTWNIINEVEDMDSEFAEKKRALYNYYRPKELDCNLQETEKFSYMQEWWHKNFNLFFEYGLKKSNLDSAIKMDKLKFRKRCKRILN